MTREFLILVQTRRYLEVIGYFSEVSIHQIVSILLLNAGVTVPRRIHVPALA
jgi:hypothetical protein